MAFSLCDLMRLRAKQRWSCCVRHVSFRHLQVENLRKLENVLELFVVAKTYVDLPLPSLRDLVRYAVHRLDVLHMASVTLSRDMTPLCPVFIHSCVQCWSRLLQGQPQHCAPGVSDGSSQLLNRRITGMTVCWWSDKNSCLHCHQQC